MKSATTLTAHSTDLSDIQFSTGRCIGVIEPGGPEKYIKTEMKLGQPSVLCRNIMNTLIQIFSVMPFNITTSSEMSFLLNHPE